VRRREAGGACKGERKSRQVCGSRFAAQAVCKEAEGKRQGEER